MNKPLHKIKYDPVKQKVIDPFNKDAGILTGYKGSSFISTGAVYAPYIPIFNAGFNATINQYGYVITVENEGIHRYTYDPNRDGDLAAMDHIEERGLIILDEDEDEHWIDAIEPQRLTDNITNGGPKLKATWSDEATKDLENMYGIKAEKSLTKIIEDALKL